MNREKARFFDDQVHEPWASGEYTREEKLKIARMLHVAGVRAGDSVLEPGCGTGRLTEIISGRVGGNGSVFAMDISPGMVAGAKAHMKGTARVRVECMGLEDLELDCCNRFDKIICHQVFPHFDNKPRALEIMADLLKPGGILAVHHFKGSSCINSMHRKKNTAVARDMIPGKEFMDGLFKRFSLSGFFFEDSEDGYLLCAEAPDKRSYHEDR